MPDSTKGRHARARFSTPSSGTRSLGLVEGTRGRPADTLIESSLPGLTGAENTSLCFDVVGCASFSEAHARVAERHPGGAMIQAMGRKIRQAIHLRASCHDLTVIPMPFSSLKRYYTSTGQRSITCLRDTGHSTTIGTRGRRRRSYACGRPTPLSLTRSVSPTRVWWPWPLPVFPCCRGGVCMGPSH